MQHNERLVRRVQAAEDRKRPRANPVDERDAVRPRATQEDDVQNNQYSAKTSGDGNRGQLGSGGMQVEGQATQAPAPGVKRLAEVVVQRDCDTRDRSSNEPIPDSGMDMNSIVTNEQCEQIIQSVLKELGFTVRKNLVENSTWYELNQASVIDVTTMNLSDEPVLRDDVEWTETNVVDWRVQVCRRRSDERTFEIICSCTRDSAVKANASCLRIQKIPSHGTRSSSTSCQSKSML